MSMVQPDNGICIETIQNRQIGDQRKKTFQRHGRPKTPNNNNDDGNDSDNK
jgi:hypothetical protein